MQIGAFNDEATRRLASSCSLAMRCIIIDDDDVMMTKSCQKEKLTAGWCIQKDAYQGAAACTLCPSLLLLFAP